MDHEQTEETIEQKKKVALKTRRLEEALQRTLSDADGRIVLKTILQWTSFETENASIGELAVRNEGIRSVGLRLIKKLREADKEGYIQLYREIING